MAHSTPIQTLDRLPQSTTPAVVDLAELVSAGQGARILGVSDVRIHQLRRAGKLRPAHITALGALYLRSDLEQLAVEMHERATAKLRA